MTMTRHDLVVSSAASAGGHSTVLRFDGRTGQYLGPLASDAEIVDPRDVVRGRGKTLYVNNGDDRVLRYDARSGTHLGTFIRYDQLNPGGSVFGPDRNYYVGARSLRAVLRFDGHSGAFIDAFVAPGLVAFPRGFDFGPDGNLYLGNGADPATGTGGGTLLRIDGKTKQLLDPQFVDDPELSPLDLVVGPDGNVYVSSEFPFATPGSVGTVRCYDLHSGQLLRVYDAGLDAAGQPRLSRPRGIGFGPDGYLYVSSTGTGTVLRFDVKTTAFIDVFVNHPGLNGQALNFVPRGTEEDER